MANEVRVLDSGQEYYVDSAGAFAGLKMAQVATTTLLKK